MKILLTTLNAKYIHKNLALRWIYQACPWKEDVSFHEYTIKDETMRIVEEIADGGFDVVCFSVYIWNIDKTMQIISALKRKDANIRILVGGPEVSFESEDLLKRGVDAISIGEGEESVWEYVGMLKENASYEIAGICTLAYPNHSIRRVSIAFLEQLEDPYFMEMDAQDMDKRYLYLETSRGCPYGCEYCLSSTDRHVRMFSLEYIMRILTKIAQSKVRQVKLLDRTFNADPKRALQIARYMNEHCIHQTFQFEVVAETLSEELLTFFEQECDPKRFRFEIGVQSFHEQTLQSVGRYQNNARLKEVIHRLRRAQLVLHVDLIAGLPYEDEQCFEQSFNELFALRCEECQLGMLKVLKGTGLKQKQHSYGYVYDQQAPYTIQKTNWLSESQLYSIHQSAEALEKYWNSGKCRYTISELLDNGYVSSAYQLFRTLGKSYAGLPRPYALPQLFQAFLAAFDTLDRHMLRAMLNMDYYRLGKQRLPHFHEDKLSKEERKRVKQFAKAHGISAYDLDHYCAMCYGWMNKTIGYLLIIYDQKQSVPRRYWCDQKGKQWKELM